MNLLACKLYDPAVAVTKSTAALLAMTALDTTNLRLTVTVPAHGMLAFRLAGVVHGAATFPTILLGVKTGATVVGRVPAIQRLGNTAVATAQVSVVAEFCVSGLTPGVAIFDAAYGVEVIVAATGIKYGGPNDAVANNAFGGFNFQVYDPQPFSSAVVLPTMPIDWITAAGINADAVSEIQAGLSTQVTLDNYMALLPNQTALQTWDQFTDDLLVTGGSIGKHLVEKLDVVVSTRATPASILTTALTESYAANGTAPTLAQLLFLVQQHLGASEVNSDKTLKAVKKIDGTTTAATFTTALGSGVRSITRAT